MDIAKAYVQILPSTEGIGSRLTSALSGAAVSAGDSAGKSAGAKFASALGAAAKVGAAGLAATTAAVTAFGKSSVDAGMSFDTSMSQVAATMGKTMQEMQNEIGSVDLAWGTFSGNLRDYAMEMGANTAFSATQAADALNYMALAGYDTQTAMEMLPNVMSLAAAGGFNLARASDMITDTQTAFGISLERTSQMVDEMAKAASTGNTSVEQLGDAFLVVGGLAQDLNGGVVELSNGMTANVDGVQELEIALTAMANAGVKGNEAGTHMRNMLLKLSSPTDKGAAAFEKLGVSVFDAGGQMRSLQDIFSDLSKGMDGITQEEKLQAISDIFNTRDIAAAEALLAAVDQDWNAIGESILDAKGSAQQMADTQLDNLAGDITLFKSALEGARIIVSDDLVPSLREFVHLGTSGLSEITTAFKEGGLSGAMEAFGGFLSNAAGMIIEKIPSLVDAGAQMLTAVIQGISENVPMLTSAAVQIVTSLAGLIIDNLPVIVEAGISQITGFASGIAEALPELVPAAVDTILALVDALIDNTPQLIEAALQLMVGLAEGLVKAIPKIIEKIPEIISALVGALLESIPKIGEAGGELLGSIVRNLPEIITNVVSAIPTIIDEIVQAILLGVPSIIGAGVNLISGLGQGILDGAVAVIEKAKQVAGDVLGAIKGFFRIESPSKVMQDEVGKMMDLGWAGGIEQNKGFILNAMTGVGSDMMDSFAGSIGGMASGAVERIADGLQDVTNTTTRRVGEALLRLDIDWSKVSLDDPRFFKGFLSDLDWNAIANEAGTDEGFHKNWDWIVENYGFDREVARKMLIAARNTVNGIGLPEEILSGEPSFTAGDLSSLSTPGRISMPASSYSVNSARSRSSVDLERIERILNEILNTLMNMGVYIDKNTLIGQIAPGLDSEFARMYTANKREAAYA